MNSHINARTTPYARASMVARRDAGAPVAEIAAAFGVSPRTVFKWLARFRAEGEAGLANRSSRPRRAPRYREAALLMRRTFKMTGEQIAEALRLARSSVARWLAEAGLSRLARLTPAEPVRRYQRERPGELIHIDIKKLGRFARPGHRVTGARTGHGNRGAGWDFVHVAIDDATRLAYAEVLPDERRASAAGFLVRAVRWYREQGVGVERVMSDNGSAYVSKLFARTMRRLGLRHIRTRPYTPKTNGKAERFIQTMLREWAYAAPFPSAEARRADLPCWIRRYNTCRRHYALNRRTPAQALSDLNNVVRHHS